MWESDTEFQAWWLYKHSSSILVNTGTGPKLQMLVNFAELWCENAPMDTLRLQWALQAESGMGRYGDCDGQHGSGAVTCYGRCRPSIIVHHVHKSTSYNGQRNPASGNAQAVSSSQRRDVVSSNAQTHASASASELQSAVPKKSSFCVQGGDSHSGLLEDGGGFREACWNGKVCLVRLLLFER